MEEKNKKKFNFDKFLTIGIIVCAIVASIGLFVTPKDEANNPNAFTEQDIIDAGYTIGEIPKDAIDLEYKLIDVKDSDVKMAEVKYSYDKMDIVFRQKATAEIKDDFEDISEMYFNWANENENTKVEGRPARAYWNSGVGEIVWFDVIPGVVYSLTISAIDSVNTIDEALLIEKAESIFEPLQGEN